MRTPPIGRTIGLIGLDGTGKTCVGNTVASTLRGRGFPAQRLYVPVEPFSSVMKVVRTHGKYASFFGYSLAVKLTSMRFQSLSRDPKGILVCDRWIGDTIASHLAQGVSPLIVRATTRLLRIPRPEIYVLLTCDLEERRRRMIQGRGVFSDSDRSHLEMDRLLRRLYREHITEFGGTTIDTTRRSIEEVAGSVVNKLDI